MTTTTSVTDNSAIANLNKKSTTNAKDATATSDRFLKLLVTQLQNQDPLNPMDNAQVTSQMAQINTVTGIEKLNTTMSTSLSQMQLMQGASLVGHQVLLEGNKLAVDTTQGIGVGSVDLSSSASSVKIQIINGSGTVIDTVDEGSLTQGRHSFQWKVPDSVDASKLTFKVVATNGSKSVTNTPLMVDTVNAVSTTDGTLNLELSNSGTTAYSKVKAIA